MEDKKLLSRALSAYVRIEPYNGGAQRSGIFAQGRFMRIGVQPYQ
jgi:hypothetical protein